MFGTLLPSEEAVRWDVLDARRDELVAALGRLEGFVQLNVRVLYDEDALLREVVANEPRIAATTAAMTVARMTERNRNGHECVDSAGLRKNASST